MKARIVDEAISHAWLEAAKDLGIRVAAPFAVETAEEELITSEAHVLDFGGPKGAVVGVLDDKLSDCRATQGYYCSNLAPSYRRYVRQHFIETLNDWGWFGRAEFRPAWYTGKSWS
jgi:cytosine/adenosine deaminase-related metal-dependent hydrolase